jgi:hypothetical protein
VLLSSGAVALGAVTAAQASVCVCVGGRDPSVRVSPKGHAEVGWTTRAGLREHAVVRPSGRVDFGTRIKSDVSRKARQTRLPYGKVIRRTPDGRLWAIQMWRPDPAGRAQLRFSRWKGQPTRLSSRVWCCRRGQPVVSGEATFQGRPVFGRQDTKSGSMRIGVRLDCFRCRLNRGGWARATRAPTRGPDGAFAVRLRPRWEGTKYRVTIVGPNLGRPLAPDARSVVRARATR